MKYTRVAPLSGLFFLTSIIGFLVSVFYVYPRDNQYGFSFAVLCVIMFIASVISMTYAPEKMEEEVDELEKRTYHSRPKKKSK